MACVCSALIMGPFAHLAGIALTNEASSQQYKMLTALLYTPLYCHPSPQGQLQASCLGTEGAGGAGPRGVLMSFGSCALPACSV